MSAALPDNEQELELLLSEPDEQTIEAIATFDGDIIVLGAGGKMGPTLARMARRAFDVLGTRRDIIAVSRFSDRHAAEELERHGVRLVRADLSDAAQVKELPDAPNVVWMAGQKFGTSGDPVTTWAHNVVASGYAAERYAGSRVVCFSTGNVYGRSSVANGGSRESDLLSPDGEYAASCIGRERVFEAIARRTSSPLLLYRLFYACDLRYGVLTDLALRIWNGEPVSLTSAWVNVIWQGDANRLALRSLGVADSPSVALNVTGPMHSVVSLANELGKRMGKKPEFIGQEGSDALVANIDRLNELLPHTPLPLSNLLDWTTHWVTTGRRLLGKPTKFEIADGRF